MDDEMRAAALFGELKMVAVKLVAVKSESKFHASDEQDEAIRAAVQGARPVENYSDVKSKAQARSLIIG
jgi:hypothetical protein